jgi:hypothetical protein
MTWRGWAEGRAARLRVGSGKWRLGRRRGGQGEAVWVRDCVSSNAGSLGLQLIPSGSSPSLRCCQRHRNRHRLRLGHNGRGGRGRAQRTSSRPPGCSDLHRSSRNRNRGSGGPPLLGRGRRVRPSDEGWHKRLRSRAVRQRPMQGPPALHAKTRSLSISRRSGGGVSRTPEVRKWSRSGGREGRLARRWGGRILCRRHSTGADSGGSSGGAQAAAQCDRRTVGPAAAAAGA